MAELGLALVAHHPLVAALEQKPVEAGQVFFQVIQRRHGLAGGHPELLPAAFRLQVEGVEKFAVRQHRQGGELLGALAADRGHDLLQRPRLFPLGRRLFPLGGMAGEGGEVGTDAELTGQQAADAHQHDRPPPVAPPRARTAAGTSGAHQPGQQQQQLGQQRQHEAEVFGAHQAGQQQAPQGEAQPPGQAPALCSAGRRLPFLAAQPAVSR